MISRLSQPVIKHFRLLRRNFRSEKSQQTAVNSPGRPCPQAFLPGWTNSLDEYRQVYKMSYRSLFTQFISHTIILPYLFLVLFAIGVYSIQDLVGINRNIIWKRYIFDVSMYPGVGLLLIKYNCN